MKNTKWTQATLNNLTNYAARDSVYFNPEINRKKTCSQRKLKYYRTANMAHGRLV